MARCPVRRPLVVEMMPSTLSSAKLESKACPPCCICRSGADFHWRVTCKLASRCQQMFSLLEPVEHRNRDGEQLRTARPVEYLLHHHQGVWIPKNLLMEIPKQNSVKWKIYWDHWARLFMTKVCDSNKRCHISDIARIFRPWTQIHWNAVA